MLDFIDDFKIDRKKLLGRPFLTLLGVECRNITCGRSDRFKKYKDNIYICECGYIINGEFEEIKHKSKFSCGADICPFHKENMDLNCIKSQCSYLIERCIEVDMIEKAVRERAKRFWEMNKHLKKFLLDDLEGNRIKCDECGNFKFLLYKKFGGIVRGKYNKIVKDEPITYNFICQCGCRLVLKEGTFNYGKVKFGCGAGTCPFGKTKMDKGCLTCKYIYEK